ncbi:MAG: hypothetical protein PHI40_04120, partial [Caldisericia bacterium]|nr:hypothetical protein [Caldisericia bacterium]
MQDLRGIEALEYEEIFKKFQVYTTYIDFVNHYDSIKNELVALKYTPSIEYQKKMSEQKDFFREAKNEIMTFQNLIKDTESLFIEAQKENNPRKYLK